MKSVLKAPRSPGFVCLCAVWSGIFLGGRCVISRLAGLLIPATSQQHCSLLLPRLLPLPPRWPAGVWTAEAARNPTGLQSRCILKPGQDRLWSKRAGRLRGGADCSPVGLWVYFGLADPIMCPQRETQQPVSLTSLFLTLYFPALLMRVLLARAPRVPVS